MLLGFVHMSGDMTMSAVQSDHFGATYSSKPPVLIGGSSEAAIARAVRAIEAAELRVGDTMSVGDARERIDQQIAASAVWLELDRDAGSSMDQLLDYVDGKAADGRFAAIVSTTAELIDPIAARLPSRSVELLVDADDAERAAALAIAIAQPRMDQRLSDVASDQSADRLRQLSDEVSRIATALSRLSAGPASVAPPLEPLSKSAGPEVSAETIRSIIRARRLRARFFSEELFADPAWDMLLDLLQAEIAQLRVPVSSLCIAAAVPATTALRWLKAMVSNGLFVRRADPHDGRRVFVELSPDASTALRRYFAEVGKPVVI
jgi:DNA-binding MarR family transcriptional regulator